MSQQAIDAVKSYYNTKVESFFDVWGGEHIHYGIYHDDQESLSEASQRTVENMYALLTDVPANANVLDLGSGFGGASRFLTGKGHRVTCVDVSSENNRINRQLSAEQGIDAITILEEPFESLSLPDKTFDVVWSQEAICHSAALEKVFSEALRVLKAGGEFVLGNTCCSESIPADVLEKLNQRNPMTLQTIDFHSKLAMSLGFEESVCMDMSDQLSLHYSKMLQEARAKEAVMVARDGQAYFDRVVRGLAYWMHMCDEGYLAWGIWKFVKPSIEGAQ
ncbi:MAG: hypothetical protein ETSY2_30490 [Candidatus Entotheonella gemina]|uniref:Methyltransferase type 11 domain-containing protein n=1 Tax=Candidatus Entotheonella gemina TaxID=1429439 RepID=W4M2F0_9BACT|nr:MAG: hypothetical protein ETSY2_30490 [Candidatus Entotheonella gemina]